MLSRSEYRGKLPYDTYVKRYKMHEQAIFPTKKSTDLPKPDKDIPPTQEEIKKYLDKNKQELGEKTKDLIKKQIEKKKRSKLKNIQDDIRK